MAPPYRFNVGGTRYEVAPSLLKQYPVTMLARLASETWNDGDAAKEIYIERDGESFRHVLRFLRDGKVMLPLSEPKESFIVDLLYYGIHCGTTSIQQLTESPGFTRLALDHINSIKDSVKKMRDVIHEEQTQLSRQLDAKKVELQYIQLAANSLNYHFPPRATSSFTSLSLRNS
jgi:hypothetical protein